MTSVKLLPYLRSHDSHRSQGLSTEAFGILRDAGWRSRESREGRLSIEVCFEVVNTIKRVHEAQRRRGREHLAGCILFRMRTLIAWKVSGLSALLCMCRTVQCGAMPCRLDTGVWDDRRLEVLGVAVKHCLCSSTADCRLWAWPGWLVRLISRGCLRVQRSVNNATQGIETRSR
jgi:hypothetical protein